MGKPHCQILSSNERRSELAKDRDRRANSVRRFSAIFLIVRKEHASRSLDLHSLIIVNTSPIFIQGKKFRGKNVRALRRGFHT